MSKNKTWRLIHPDKTESLFNYDPLKDIKKFGEELERKKILDLIKECELIYLKRFGITGGTAVIKIMKDKVGGLLS